jgi:hypothetical protein
MSGRYAFSLPEPRRRDGWFQIGSFDMTTTALIVVAGLLSMFLYALNPASVAKGYFATDLVRGGEVWRLLTWPLVNPPDIWVLVGLAVFWFLGHLVEDEVGRVPYAWIVLAMTVIPTAIVTLTGVANNDATGHWAAFSYSVAFLSLGMITIFGIEHPNLRFFFGIPAWVIAAAYVFIEVLRDVGNRAWAQLLLVLLVIAVGCIGARQRGLLEQLSFIPRLRRLGPGGSTAGGSSRASSRTGSRRSKGPKRRSTSGPTVVNGPWQQGGAPSGGISPLEQAELDVLLDKIGAGGVDSLTSFEKARLNELSQRMRDS